MKIIIPKDYVEDQDGNDGQNPNISLKEIIEHPEEEGEEEERTIMRNIFEENGKGDGEGIQLDALAVQRYPSIFEE